MKRSVIFADENYGVIIRNWLCSCRKKSPKSETRNTGKVRRYRRALFLCFSVSRRLAMPFLPEGLEGCALSFLSRNQKTPY
jgi:hypothetical protein